MTLQSGIVKTIGSTVAVWYPTPSPTLTGTFSSRGRTIDGTGTLALSEFSVGDYLLNTANNELQQIARVESPILFFLEDPFTTPLVGASCQRIKNNHLKEIRLVFTGPNNGSIRGAKQAAGVSCPWPPSVAWNIKCDAGIDPQFITPGSTGTACVTTVE